MKTPSIKEDFEKAFEDYPSPAKIFCLAGAKWMAERCARAQRPLLRDMISRGEAADTCRQLASELGGINE